MENSLEAPVAFESRRGPEPIDALPNAGIEAVEEAKAFAAEVVRPEPIEVELPAIDTTLLSKIAASPEIADALAAEGLEINQDEVARAIEENKRRTELETVLSPDASFHDLRTAFVEAAPSEDLAPVTPEAIHELKLGINASFEEVASLLLEHQRQIDEIEVRLAEHNRRGGHKI